MPSSKATQDFVPIKEIRDGVVILKNGSLRAVVMTSSVNLALKSEDEHNAIISQFQNLINSLDFSVQIIVQSRELNIQPYIDSLEKRVLEQTEELLRIQTKEYIEFIKWFSSVESIMTKSFYVVVPYEGAIVSSGSGGGGLLGKLGVGKQSSTETQRFEEQRSQLEQRVAVIQQGLNSMGVRNEMLETQELIELYYGTFNPEEPRKSMNMDNDPKTYSKES